MTQRPWIIDDEQWDQCINNLFPTWLKERNGVVVYENHMMDSSNLGDLSFMPFKYLAEDGSMREAPNRLGDVPSRFQERVDHIRLEEFSGDLEKALQSFVRRSTSRPTP